MENVKFNHQYNAMTLEGSYHINAERKQICVEMLSPYAGLKTLIPVMRRTFDEYVKDNALSIAEKWLEFIYHAVERVKSNPSLYRSYLSDYDHLFADAFNDANAFDDFFKANTHWAIEGDKRVLKGNTPEINVAELLEEAERLDILKNRALKEEYNLRAKYFDESNLYDVPDTILIKQILDMINK